MAANPTLIGTNLFNRYGKQAEARKPERALALSVFSLESEYSTNDQADRGRETNREAEPRVD